MLRNVSSKLLRQSSVRLYSSHSSRLGHTSVFVQSGLKIRELPLVVKKVNDVLQIGSSQAQPLHNNDKRQMPPSCDHLDAESCEIMAGFDRCCTVNGILRLLETIPAEEVTPPVAIHVLKRIINLEENNLLRRNNSADLQNNPMFNTSVGKADISKHGETFLRFAFINMLLDIVYRSRDPRIIMAGLQIVSQDSFPDDSQTRVYKERMYEETLVLVTEGLFSLVQICDTVSILSRFWPHDKKRCHEMSDKLWAGILDRSSKELNAETMASVFNVLPHLKSSRDIVFKLVERHVGDHWQLYKTRDIMEMLRVLTELNGAYYNSRRILPVISQWLAVNVQNLSEQQLLAVVVCMNKLEYVDARVIGTLEKYMKVRGVQIKEKDLVGAICDYCYDFRIRSKFILEGAGEYFIEHANSLSTPQMYSVARIFGELDFHPPNGFRYWEILEHILEHKFVEFPPREIIALLLSFVKIEQYPLNFVRKLFNPYFMDRLHSQQEVDIFNSRAQLILFDVAMKQDCEQYTGPFLPRDTNYKRLAEDPRIIRMSKNLVEPLAQVVGDIQRIGRSVVLSSLPLNPLYVADLMVYPSVAASLIRFGLRTSNNRQTTIVLIHTPEHYDYNGTHLVGTQVMRVRHLTKMGFSVMQVNFRTVSRLVTNPGQLHDYLLKEYNKATTSK